MHVLASKPSHLLPLVLLKNAKCETPIFARFLDPDPPIESQIPPSFFSLQIPSLRKKLMSNNAGVCNSCHLPHMHLLSHAHKTLNYILFPPNFLVSEQFGCSTRSPHCSCILLAGIHLPYLSFVNSSRSFTIILFVRLSTSF